MKLLSASDILATESRVYKVVEIPEWNGAVRLRSMTGKERDEFEAGLSDKKGKSNFSNVRGRLIAKCAVDSDGELLFRNRVEVADLGDKSIAGLQRLFNACQALNGFSDSDLEDLIEDFAPAPSEVPDELSTTV